MNKQELAQVLDDLLGEVDTTVSVLRGEAEELDNRDVVDADDISEQMRHRAEQLETTLDAFYDVSDLRGHTSDTLIKSLSDE